MISGFTEGSFSYDDSLDIEDDDYSNGYDTAVEYLHYHMYELDEGIITLEKYHQECKKTIDGSRVLNEEKAILWEWAKAAAK